jgi:hypothetical protein
VFSCDTYHQMNGRVAILDSHPRGFVSGLFGHRVQKEEVRREMEDVGYLLVDDYDLIDRQHFQIFAKSDTENP